MDKTNRGPATPGPPNRISGYASLFNAPDDNRDVVLPGAFARSLGERPPHAVRMLFQHDPARPIGTWTTIREDPRGLYVEGQLATDAPSAADIARLIEAGALDGLSIGFRARKARKDAEGRRLIDVDLWEVSLVTFPLLAGARLTRRPPADALAQAARTLTLALRNTPQ